MKKVTGIIFATVLLALVGCDDKNAASSTSSSGGNFAAKPETLSSDNKTDIKSDLDALNSIMNASNSAAMKLREDIVNAAKNKDMDALKKAYETGKANIEKINEQLLALTVKSKEIQDIRVKIYAGNKIAADLIDLAKKGADLSEDDKKQMMLLQKQSVAMQADYGQKLDKLNAEYNK
ncbi:hypothetical protein C9426_05705 [Serratia sp. S1B]|nr:hypothetical protein C9426_05705 [Serratia sp. S1B]